jgi:phosphate transport system substrate-binding protein
MRLHAVAKSQQEMVGHRPALPDAPILVYGPQPSSGTRGVFTELVMAPGAKSVACLNAMAQTDSAAFSSMADTFRDDGAWMDAGENDGDIVKTLDSNRNAYGVFGFSFLEQNSDLIQGSTVGGVKPTFETIASGQCRLSRTLYFYIKKAHVARLPAITDCALEFLSAEASGERGCLKEMGLVPLPEKEREAYHKMIESETVIRR